MSPVAFLILYLISYSLIQTIAALISKMYISIHISHSSLEYLKNERFTLFWNSRPTCRSNVIIVSLN